MDNCCANCANYKPISQSESKEKELFWLAMIRKRKEKERSQKWVAKQLHVDLSCISLYESGKRIPRADRFIEICDILEIDPRNVQFE